MRSLFHTSDLQFSESCLPPASSASSPPAPSTTFLLPTAEREHRAAATPLQEREGKQRNYSTCSFQNYPYFLNSILAFYSTYNIYFCSSYNIAILFLFLAATCTIWSNLPFDRCLAHILCHINYLLGLEVDFLLCCSSQSFLSNGTPL